MTSNSLNCLVFVLNLYSFAASFAVLSFGHCIPTQRIFLWLEGLVLSFADSQWAYLFGDTDKTQGKKAS